MESATLSFLLFTLQTCFLVRAEERQKLTFAAIGDFGGIPVPPFYTTTQRKIAALMGKVAELNRVSFIIGLGDNFYYEGVKKVDDPRFIDTFENVYTGPSLEKATWYMIAGNHDHNLNVSAQIAYSKVSPRWYFPDFFYTEERLIPGSTATVQLVMIDTTLLCYRNRKHSKDLPSQREQLDWIEQTLRESTATYLLVAGHHPVLSVGIHGSTPCLVDKLQPLLEEYDVTAFLSGHDHNLQHLKDDSSNVHYFVTGNGNFFSPLMLHRKGAKKLLKFFYGHTGAFTLFEATPDCLNVLLIEENGTIVYRETLQPRTIFKDEKGDGNPILDDFFTSQS